VGNWNKELEYDENLVDENLNIGEVHDASSVLPFNGMIKASQGNFHQANLIVTKLDEISEVYDNDYIRTTKCILNAHLLIQCMKLKDALDELDAGISLANRIGFNMMAVSFFSMKAYAQILLKEIDGAKESLSQAEELASREKRLMPISISSLLLSQFLFDLYMLEESIHSQNQSEVTQFRKKTYKNGKAALKISKKFSAIKTGTYKLMGLYYWLIGKQRKAFAWWEKAIKTGEHLGARPELARTYMEVGKRLLEKKNKLRQLNGIDGNEYLEKAKVLFKEMELEWDLDELDKIKSQIGEMK
jgi:tetratricopeptide (TPR) repeat protein